MDSLHFTTSFAPGLRLHFRDHRPVPEGLHDHLDILPDLFLRPGIPQQIGRVVGRHQRNPLITVKPSAQDADGRLRFQQGMGRKGSEGADHPRADRLELPDQKGFAGGDLLRLRIPVPGRAALQDVADVDLLPFQPHRVDDLRQQLPGAADERPSLRVLIRARRLADKDQFRMGIPLAEDETVTETAEGTAPAVAELRPDRLQAGPLPGGRFRPPASVSGIGSCRSTWIFPRQIGEGFSQLPVHAQSLRERPDQVQEFFPRFRLSAHPESFRFP